MSKDKIIDSCAKQLSSQGLSVSRGGQADLVVKMEFESKTWPFGKKVVTYDALIWLDEGSTTVSLWEATAETSSGLSIKAESESYSQVGKSLHRRIKGVFLGPDGQRRNYDLDLGAVSLAIKDLAAQYGWRYVVRLKK